MLKVMFMEKFASLRSHLFNNANYFKHSWEMALHFFSISATITLLAHTNTKVKYDRKKFIYSFVLNDICLSHFQVPIIQHTNWPD